MESSGRPSYEELARLVVEQDATIASQDALIVELSGQAERLERQVGEDSRASSRQPSSDKSPYTKAPKRSSRASSGRPRGKQPGEPGQTRNMVADPDEVVTVLLGARVSAGWVATVRDRAARLLETSFLPWTRALIAAAPVAHADETVARAAGGLRYLHVACTDYLTVMHTGNRSAATIDAGGIWPTFTGTLVRDGYLRGEQDIARWRARPDERCRGA